MTVYYKVMRKGGMSLFGHAAWGLPKGSKAGEWQSVDGPLALCVNGLHVCTDKQLDRWARNSHAKEVYLAEILEDDDHQHHYGKTVARYSRLVRLVARKARGRWVAPKGEQLPKCLKQLNSDAAAVAQRQGELSRLNKAKRPKGAKQKATKRKGARK